MISSLRSRGYRLVFFGQLGQMASMNIQMVTNPLLIFRLTESPALLGVLSLAGAVPTISFGLFGGAIADRIRKKSILIAGYVLLALIALGIALALDTGQLSKEHSGSWWILMVATVIQGSVMGLMMPSLMAIVPEVVKREDLMNAMAMNSLSMAVISLAVPGLAGVLIDRAGFEAVYYCMVGLYCAAIPFLIFLPHVQPSTGDRGRIFDNITKGLGYIRGHATILFILAFSFTVVILAGPYQQFLPIYVDDILHVGATGLGLLMSLAGAGSVIGSLALAAVPNRKRGWLLLAGGIIAAIALGLFAFSTWWWLSLATMVFLGLANTLRNTISGALLQSYAEPEYMGRVMSLNHIQFGVMSVAAFFVGMLAEIVQVQYILAAMAAMLFVVSICTLAANRQMRQIE